eukprot:CAMPEP_0175054124 /NCGR_PEP_ID=MMETSP0052_2-20121109/9323_1 /TAXON_ID=51329 ORGANISM="Polytomella parva, Strain SAG 63-3" /NCGR_SAMPLE_ID=MMETSP0052_2 /ASSEMBLY_ACC=CAM_ASM_000194 /LENGTH=534 /DNA_ID=CAMNT_0016318769 /DNA_START=180 /DNA_END=1781 /DNA_ORIENTATION=+
MSTPAIPEGYVVKKEGKASILMKGNDVFYNEAQVTNRDLSVAVLKRFLPLRAKEIQEKKLKLHHNHNIDLEKAKKQQRQRVQEQERKAKEAAAAENADDSSSSSSSNPQSGGCKGARVLEGLAASGLRSIRYALEVPSIGRIDANDLDHAASAAMLRNIELNGGAAKDKIFAQNLDARILMMSNPITYDAVDLDPYGTPAHLLDSAVQSVTEGGLLLVTATDMANLCGNNGTACHNNYGSYPVHRPYCHEMALRILLGCIEAHANRYKRHIVPLLSLSIDFYVRVFVRVYTSPGACKESATTKQAYIWQSSGCDSFWMQPVGQQRKQNSSCKFLPGPGPAMEAARCPDTGSGFIMGGPIWSAPIHQQDFVRGLLADFEEDKGQCFAAYPKIRGLLTSALEELPDVPLYYDLHDLCKTVHCQPPKKDVFRAALLNAGFRVSGSHAKPLAIKTDAPPAAIWDILRCWIQDHPAPAAVKDPNSYSAKLLAKAPQIVADFARVAGAVSKAKEDKVPRFVQNPAFWGPKARHGRVDTTR